jgi:hypothetical protein
MGAEDLLVTDAAQQQVDVLVNDVRKHGSAVGEAASSSDFAAVSMDTNAPVAVQPMPQKFNGERDLMILTAGKMTAAPVPLASVNLTVNNITDQIRNPGNLSLNCSGGGTDCSLREAVLKANLNAGPNTINVPGNIGTYNLSVNNPNNPGGTGTMAFRTWR